MTDYRRSRVSGTTFFFTVNLYDRRSRLLIQHIDILRHAVRQTQRRAPLHIDAWVVLPGIWQRRLVDYAADWPFFSSFLRPLARTFIHGRVTSIGAASEA